jgi:hypothetical protein
MARRKQPSVPTDDVIGTLTRVIEAWERLRPHKKFAGMTLEEFKKAVQPSFDAHAEVALLERQIQRLRAQIGETGPESSSIH